MLDETFCGASRLGNIYGVGLGVKLGYIFGVGLGSSSENNNVASFTIFKLTADFDCRTRSFRFTCDVTKPAVGAYHRFQSAERRTPFLSMERGKRPISIMIVEKSEKKNGEQKIISVFLKTTSVWIFRPRISRISVY